MELFALRFLFLNLNSYVCLWIRCFESGKGMDGGGKTNSNCVLISYAQSMQSFPHPAHIFGLIRLQSKRNPSVQKGLPYNSIINKSSYVQCKPSQSNVQNDLNITRLFLNRVMCRNPIHIARYYRKQVIHIITRLFIT